MIDQPGEPQSPNEAYHPREPRRSDQAYEPPKVEDIPAQDGPAVTAAGGSPTQAIVLLSG
jgi:hypothetical protein